jgi:TldD protein
VLERLLDALRDARAGFTEIRFERTWLTTVAWRGRRLEAAAEATDAGGHVRSLEHGHGWGFASFSRPEELPARVALARELSRATRPPQPVALAPQPVRDWSYLPDLAGDARDVPLAEKCALVEALNGEMLAFDRRIVDTRCAWQDGVTEFWYVNSEGTRAHGIRPHAALSALAVAREGGTVERAVESMGAHGGWVRAHGREELVRGAARRAVSLLGAQPVRSGSYPVVLDPRLAGVVAHEAVGHLCEADAARDAGRPVAPVGTRLGSERLTIGDDGSAPGLASSMPFDDEGTPTGNTLILQNGVVVSHLHTRESAALAAGRATGNARTTSWRHAPLARMTGTYVASGSGTRDDLFRDVKLGVYAVDAIAARRHGDDIAFTAGEGYMIRDGELAELVKHVVVAGRVTDLLGAVDRVAGDFRWHESGGGCSRYGQGPLPVAEGAPHVRLERAEVRGVAP